MTYQDHYIHPCLNEQIQSVFVIFTGSDGGAAQQLFARVFGGERVVPVLLQIRAGDNSHQLVFVIHNWQFTCSREDVRSVNIKQLFVGNKGIFLSIIKAIVQFIQY